MTEWLASLGYLGALLGAAFEGEISFLAVLQAVRLGYLNFYYVLLSVFVGAQAVDWFIFLAARRGGTAVLERHPGLEARLRRMSRLLERRSTLLLLSYRFLYGFRIVLPTLFGVSSITKRRFGLLSFISTLLWVSAIGYGGYFFTAYLEAFLLWVQHYAIWAALAVLLLAGGAWLGRQKWGAFRARGSRQHREQWA
ncbi:MAG: VTT domain-containing protein [Phaeodactylibacter sp.]|nr:VTT domain-containing protein [Phaeodactylibacter sp.]